MESSKPATSKIIQVEEFKNKTQDSPDHDHVLDAAAKEKCAGDESGKKKKRKRGKKKKKPIIQDSDSDLKEAGVIADTAKKISLSAEVKQLRKENIELRRQLAELKIKSKGDAMGSDKIAAGAVGGPGVTASPKKKGQAKNAVADVSSGLGRSEEVTKSSNSQKKETVQDSEFKDQSCEGSLTGAPAAVAGSSSGNTKQRSKKKKPPKEKKKAEQNVYDCYGDAWIDNPFDDGPYDDDFVYDDGIAFDDLFDDDGCNDDYWEGWI